MAPTTTTTKLPESFEASDHIDRIKSRMVDEDPKYNTLADGIIFSIRHVMKGKTDMKRLEGKVDSLPDEIFKKFKNGGRKTMKLPFGIEFSGFEARDIFRLIGAAALAYIILSKHELVP